MRSSSLGFSAQLPSIRKIPIANSQMAQRLRNRVWANIGAVYAKANRHHIWTAFGLSARRAWVDDRSAAVGHNAGPAVVVAEIVAKHDRGPAQTLVRLLVRAANGALYCGISDDAQRRFAEHQRGRGARFFHSSPAQALVYVEACASKGDALRREIAIKRLDKRERLVSQAGPVA